jgi:hypothetical protein
MQCLKIQLLFTKQKAANNAADPLNVMDRILPFFFFHVQQPDQNTRWPAK